jgi:hypothetical protein
MQRAESSSDRTQTTLQACFDYLGGLPVVKNADSQSPAVRATRCLRLLLSLNKAQMRTCTTIQAEISTDSYAAIKDPELRCFAVLFRLYLHFPE